MKTLILTAGLLLAAMHVSAQKPEQLNIKNGGHAVSKHGRVTIKFLELIEDSRCPVDVECIWAGVARIKIRLSRNGKSVDTELNTTDKGKTTFQGYTVFLKDLQPRQSTTSKYSPSAYSAAFTISKASR